MTSLDRRRALTLAGAGAAGSLLAPARAAAQAGGPRLLVLGAGATFPAPLYAAWIGALGKLHPELDFTYDAIGSSGGVSRFVTGSVDFGASDAAMTDAQIVQVARGVRLIPATAGMVVVAYNLPGFTGPLRLPRDVLPAIFTGEIKRWDDPRIAAANPGKALPRRSIGIVARRDGSGTTFAFTNHLAAISPDWAKAHGAANRVDWPGAAMLMPGNEGVAGRLRQTENALAYVEHGFAARLGLPAAELQNRSGAFVAPGAQAGVAALAEAAAEMPENLRQFVPDPPGAESYPIVTYSWLLLYGSYPDARKRDAVKTFVRFGLTEGQKTEGLEYLPLPEAVVSRGLASLDSIT
jgi:phosphate transport system substrate-binding protein